MAICGIPSGSFPSTSLALRSSLSLRSTLLASRLFLLLRLPHCLHAGIHPSTALHSPPFLRTRAVHSFWDWGFAPDSCRPLSPHLMLATPSWIPSADLVFPLRPIPLLGIAASTPGCRKGDPGPVAGGFRPSRWHVPPCSQGSGGSLLHLEWYHPARSAPLIEGWPPNALTVTILCSRHRRQKRRQAHTFLQCVLDAEDSYCQEFLLTGRRGPLGTPPAYTPPKRCHPAWDRRALGFSGQVLLSGGRRRGSHRNARRILSLESLIRAQEEAEVVSLIYCSQLRQTGASCFLIDSLPA